MKKDTIRKLLILAACLITIAASASSVSAAVYRETTSKVNLRSKAGSTSSDTVIGTIPKGATVQLVGKSTKYSGWYYVTYDGKSGFVDGSYLTTASSSEDDDDDDTGSGETKTVSTNLNLRSSAKIADGNVITVIPKGGQVTIISESGGWYKVKYGSKTGYVKDGYFTDSTSSTGTKRIVDANLRLRSSAKITSGNIILTIPKGSTVTVLKTVNDDWYYVQYDGTKGYVKSGYFRTNSSSDSEGSSASGTMRTTAALRLRSSRSTSSSDNIITVIPKGTSVKIKKQYSGWYYVSYNGMTGYVSSDYLE
jgi:uncharacterized protein YgiM (DUF1202 family)